MHDKIFTTINSADNWLFWRTGNRLFQSLTDEKGNKITPIPALLDLLALEGAIINIDAMDCRQQIAEKIIHHKADYVLAVKENKPRLPDDNKRSL
ncbi:ISAs1 family transposase [Terrimonas sp.]|uniref:ISAs1 family transposase n=1 Tax=Terrimonas sp. TaxID=1914338 RepID=UPI000D5123AC|nr:ISAs1 family transposase [Terrimonas sp.]PVD51735.1 ISAs1 family transposase [Terrimonas sp.]